MIFDAVIRGGLVVDGTGAPPWPADIGIAQGVIAAVGRLEGAPAAETVDATGRCILPGFVDAHSHADRRVMDDDVQLALLRQGVTTIVTGQDGVSFAPGGHAATTWAGEYFDGINGPADPEWRDGLSLPEYRGMLDGRVRINTAHLLPHGTLRFDVAGLTRSLDADQQRELRKRVEAGMSDGACGMSTGLHYVPGLYGDVAEFADLCRPLAAAGRPYVTHMRGYEAEAWIGLAEVRQVAEQSGVSAHISHFHGPANMLAGLVDDARADGLDVTFDSYPYLRGFSLLTVPLLPPDLLALPPADLVTRLNAGRVLDRLKEVWAADPEIFDRAVIANAPHEEFREFEGHSVASAAAWAGREPGEFFVEIVRATRAAVTAVFQQPPTNTEDDVRALLRHEAHMAGSDGIFIGGHPHPRAFSAFARFLNRHVVQLGDWTWAQAAVHLGSHAARRFGLLRRGVLRPELAADLVLVDPRRVADTASYDDPMLLAVGIDDVWVNGSRVLTDGQLTHTLAGRALTWGD